MSNNFDSIIAEYWAKKLQIEHFKFNVYKYIGSTQYEATLSDGDVFNKSYFDAQDSELSVYTPQSDISVEDITTTNETLTVDQKFATAREYDRFQEVQNAFDIADEVAPKDAQRMANKMDYDCLAQIANAASTVDNGILDSDTADGVGIEPVPTNVIEIFARADRALEEQNISSTDRKAVMTPKLAQAVKEYLGGRDTDLGDKKVQDGNLNLSFMGYKLYVSNQMYATAVLSLVTNPSNGDTIVIDGITFTFVSSIGTTAGNVLIGGSVDVSRANLAALIGDPGTTSANQVGWATTHENYKKLTNRATATNDNSADTLTLTYKGRSNLAVSVSLTDPTDTWTANKTVANNFFCADMPVDRVNQIQPMVEITPRPLGFSRYVKRGMFYGEKMFRESTFKTVNVKTKI
jgi:hypothetical protein